MDRFYDDIAEYYHLIYADWDRSIERQGEILARLIEERWPHARSALDATCGIGTQALGLSLSRRDLRVVGSDISPGAIDRARREATSRGVAIEYSVCDVRSLVEHHDQTFDVVLSCDNALPHLLSDDEIRTALEQLHGCLSSGGGCIVSLRDYDAEERGSGLMHPFGSRRVDGRRWFIFQVWDFEGDRYDFSMYFVPEDDPSATVVSRSRYYAVSPNRVAELMREVGFGDVERLDDRFFQPLLLGTGAG